MLMSGSSNESASLTEQARKALENEILHHSLSIIDKKFCLNDLTAIARLPPELLSEVFWHYMISCARSGPFNSMPYRWIRITHVCHHWREVALRCPRLWAFISLTVERECLNEMLLRSKQVPLSVKASRAARHESLKRIFDEFHRVRDIDLTLSPMSYIQVDEFFPSSAPQLRSIILRANEGYASFDSLSLPTLLGKCSFSLLAQVEIHQYHIAWTNSLFQPTLTRLVIHAPDIGKTPPLVETLSTLQSMSLLQHLDINHLLPALPQSIETLPAIVRNIFLPNLCFLRVSDTGVACAHFLQHLSFPSSATITLAMTSIRSETQLRLLVAPIASKLSAPSATGAAPEFHSFAIWQDYISMGYPAFQLGLWTAARPVNTLGYKGLPAHCQITFSSLAISTKSVLEYTSDALPLTHVESLYVGSMPSPHGSKVAWTKMLEKMNNVSSLGIGGETVKDLPKMLQARAEIEPANEGRRRRTQPVLCQLKTVFVHDARFRPPTDDIEDQTLVRNLKKAFMARKKSRVGIEQLVVEWCINMGTGDIAQLEESVNDVKWDGQVEHEETDLDSDEDMYGFDEDYLDWDGLPFYAIQVPGLF